jgi:hypothetical protein
VSDDTRIRRDNTRDASAAARLYAGENSDRGFLARQVIRLVEEAECVCGEINAPPLPRSSGGRMSRLDQIRRRVDLGDPLYSLEDVWLLLDVAEAAKRACEDASAAKPTWDGWPALTALRAALATLDREDEQ